MFIFSFSSSFFSFLFNSRIHTNIKKIYKNKNWINWFSTRPNRNTNRTHATHTNTITSIEQMKQNKKYNQTKKKKTIQKLNFKSMRRFFDACIHCSSAACNFTLQYHITKQNRTQPIHHHSNIKNWCFDQTISATRSKPNLKTKYSIATK